MTREWVEALRRMWRDMKVVYDGEVYTVLDVDSNGALLIDKPDEFKATMAVSVSMVKLVDGRKTQQEGEKPMNEFAKAIKAQLLEYQQELSPDKYAVVSAQIRGYRLGLETCLNRSFVAMMFYDVFGDQVF